MPTFSIINRNSRLLLPRQYRGAAMLDPQFERTGGVASFGLSGVARDNSSTPVPFADVHLFDTDTKGLLATTKADASGNFAFNIPAMGTGNSGNVFAVSYKPGSPDIAGVTVNTLTMTPAPASRAINADVYIDMNSADADGALLTTTIMANGSHGSYSSWSNSTTPLTGMNIGPPCSNLGFKRRNAVVVGGVTYPVGSPSRSIAYDHHQTLRGTHLIFNAGVNAASVGWFQTFGPSNDGVSNALFDLMGFYGFTGEYASFQLDNGRGVSPGQYQVSIESNPNGVTTHSQYFDVPQGGTLYCSLQLDMLNGVARAAIFNPITFARITSTEIKTTKNDTIERLRIGNNEVGAGNSISYFGEIIVDYTKAAYPLGL
jgi:hypothetical protein